MVAGNEAMLMWRRKRPSPAQGLTVTSSPPKKHNKWVTLHQCLNPPNCIRAPQLSDYGHKRDTMKPGRERWEIRRLGLLWAALYEHTHKISKPTVSLCVCVIQSLFCIRAEQDGGKSLRTATGCCYCFLVARLPGIDKRPSGTVGAQTLLCVYFHWSFRGKTKPQV